MKRICAWCHTIINEGDGSDPRVKHSICDGCLPGWKAEGRAVIVKYNLDRKAPTAFVTVNP